MISRRADACPYCGVRLAQRWYEIRAKNVMGCLFWFVIGFIVLVMLAGW